MIRLQVLGSLSLSRADGTSIRSVLAQPKRFALLTVLASSHPRATHTRDTVLGLLWPELAPKRARRALRQSLHGLRRSLGPGVVTGKGQEHVGVDPERLWCDAVAFSRALDEGREKEALELYGGSFLKGFHVDGVPPFERWVDARRRQLRLAAVDAAWTVAGRAEEIGNHPAARRAANQALELAPFDGEAVRRFMRLMDRLGRPAAALRAYRAYESRLADEMEMNPSEETRALLARIRQGRERSPPTEVSGARRDRIDGIGFDHHPLTASNSLPVETASARGGPDSEPSPEAKAPGPGHSPPIRSGRGIVSFLVTAAAVVGLFAIGSSGSSDAGVVQAPRTVRSVAVLPFADLSPTGDQEWLGNGVAEEILSRLGTVRGLEVAAGRSSFRFEDRDPDVRTVGESLGVGSVLQGSIRRVGDRVRITVHLVRTSDGTHLWSRSFDRELSTEAIFEIEDEVARAVTDALRLELDLDGPSGLGTMPTRDLEAYSLYLQARHGIRERTPEGRREARALLLEAVGRDPDFAGAWALLAHLRAQAPFWGWSDGHTDFEEWRTLARQAGERAVELGRFLAEAHSMLGFVLSQEHEWERAERHLEQAIALNPSDPLARGSLLWQLASQGRWEEALEQARIRQRLDPLHPPANGNLAGMLMYSGHVGEAQAEWRRILDGIAVGDAQAHFIRSLQAKAHALGGDPELAVETARAAYRENGDSDGRAGPYFVSQLAAMNALAGRSARAETLLDELRAPSNPRSPNAQAWLHAFHMARVHAALNRADSAFIWLDRSRPDRWRTLEIARFRGDPWWDPIRTDPRYLGILREVGVEGGDIS
ncbi:MAG: BTAD domain-containing putative transcriptional regulator [Longimicrobiales bacterium]|nr:BTAD domain-containing putative transcriptional regulator [Longimicrobiales bacterium]